MFRGEKELFKDTWLYDNSEFEPQPVIRLNMSELDTRNEKSVEEGIKRKLKKIYRENDFQIRTDNMKYMFEDLIEELAQNKRVIVLIDEYDKPILVLSCFNRKTRGKIRCTTIKLRCRGRIFSTRRF